MQSEPLGGAGITRVFLWKSGGSYAWQGVLAFMDGNIQKKQFNFLGIQGDTLYLQPPKGA
jgi:hypothetical protein